MFKGSIVESLGRGQKIKASAADGGKLMSANANPGEDGE